jgi:hypothetical protein
MIGPAPDVGPRVEFAARGTLAGSAFWLVSSNLLYALFQWATVVALARVGVTSLGQFGVALAVTTAGRDADGLRTARLSGHRRSRALRIR